MKRRDFLKKSAGLGLAAGALASAGNFRSLFAGQRHNITSGYDLVAARGSTSVKMFEASMKPLGGMKSFVKPNQTVVVKPNIGWDVTPERAANTNPQLVGKIIEHCFDAGAKKVYVFDHTCNNWQKCYTNSGIEKEVKDAGGTMAPGNSESYYQDVTLKGTESISEAKVHELMFEADVFINVPVLKSHGSAILTMSMKNLMGIVWDRGFWHANDLHQCIAEFPLFRQPDLNIIDGYRVMKRNGPRGVSEADVVELKAMVISPDIVAADAAGAKFFGTDPGDIPYIVEADKLGIGTMDLDSLNINRIKVSA